MQITRLGTPMFLFLLGCASAAVADPTEPPSPTVRVEPGIAEIRFPIDADREWGWNVPGQERGALEYAWEIVVEAEEGSYAIGVYRFAFLHWGGHGSGTFDDLLEGAQATLWVRDSRGFGSAVEGPEVSSRREKDELIVTLHGERAVNRVFGSRPDSARIRVVTEGKEELVRPVAVRYRRAPSASTKIRP